MNTAILALGGKGRFIGKLFEGDPVAWSILGGVVAIVVIIAIVKKKSGG